MPAAGPSLKAAHQREGLPQAPWDFILRHGATKLVVGSANDPLEHEADAIASGAARAPAAGSCPQATAEAEAPSVVGEALEEAGRPLDAPVQADMSSSFGRDFSAVRIHTGARANTSARTLGATAYTAGNHIAFAAGRYDPATERGRGLIAHELAHVTQQDRQTNGSSGATLVQREKEGPVTKAPTQGPNLAAIIFENLRIKKLLEAPKRKIADRLARDFLASRATKQLETQPSAHTTSSASPKSALISNNLTERDATYVVGSSFQMPAHKTLPTQEEVVEALISAIDVGRNGNDWNWKSDPWTTTRPATGEEKREAIAEFAADKQIVDPLKEMAIGRAKAYASKEIQKKFAQKAANATIQATIKSLGGGSVEIAGAVAEAGLDALEITNPVGWGLLAYQVVDLVLTLTEDVVTVDPLAAKNERIVNAVRAWLAPKPSLIIKYVDARDATDVRSPYYR